MSKLNNSRENKPKRTQPSVLARYTSLEELRSAWGLKPVTRNTKDENKLAKQRENFLKKHICPACKKPMTFIGGNQMVCQNPECKGIKHETKTGEGTKIWYSPSYHLLNEKGTDIANNIF